MKAIVTTTIHSPTEAILKFCNKKDWIFIIVGDQKTPHEEYRELEEQFSNVHYLDPDYQRSRYKKLSDLIGWNTISRRNIGFIEAYQMGAEIISSVDDDNIPYQDWGENIYVNKEIELDIYLSELNVFDPLSVTNCNFLWHRGFPLEYLPERFKTKYGGKVKRKVLVQADLWDGDPDIDVIARIVFNPNVEFDVIYPYCSDVITPFDSQNTFLSRDVFPYYCCLPFIGRMDDIWGAYLLQKTFPGAVIYNKASVYQERNKQDLIKNMKDEMIGYENTLNFINGKFDLPENTQKFYDIYKEQFWL